MNKRWMSVMMAAGLVAGVAGAAETIAVVDSGRVLKEYYKTGLADQHMQQQMEDFATERDKLLAEHKALRQQFEALREETRNKALTEEARGKKKEQAEEKLTEVIEYENSLREKAASRKKQLEGEGRKIQMELAKAIQAAVRECATKGGYSLVLSKGGLLANGLDAVLYSDSKMEITDDVLKILNADKPAAEKE
jgi:outer membrane protein